MRKILALFVMASMLLSLAACKGKNEETTAKPVSTDEKTAVSETKEKETEGASEPVTITYCNFNASGGNEETLQKMYEAFHQEYPDITVEIETVAYSDYFVQMQTRVAGGTAPDCYELNIENFAAYASKGVLAEIAGVDTSGFNQTALNAFCVDGKQFGVPGCFSNVLLFYNKDLFDQAGIAYPTNDWTWDDAQKAAEAIRALGDDIFGIYAPITYNEFFKVAAQYGGSMLNEDKTKFTINSPENIEAANMMVNRVISSNVQPTEKQMGGLGDWDLFESGRLGMITTGIWAFNTFKDACAFQWDVCVEPGGTKKATHFFSNAYVVNASSDKQKAASTWINWLASSSASAAIRIDAGWDLPAITDQTVLSKYLEMTPPANRQAVFDSLSYLTTPPIIEEYSLMADTITEKLAAAAAGSITAEEALNQAQEAMSSVELK